ncbi:MAG: electron transport complex subunit RsxC [Eggerthellaceae bacterium]|nr:electron transport complex subunit RsxC [Eggerthellaceae bacterium]
MGMDGIFRKRIKSVIVNHDKNTATCASVRMPLPGEVAISMSQHIGAPCTPLVKKRDYVKVGQVIGDSDAPFSAPIHASVSGTVKDITTVRAAMGGTNQVVVIEPDGLQEIHESVAPPKVTNTQEFIEAVHQSGLVGLGGAGFPTHIKFNSPNLANIDTLVVNGAECEPYITTDHRLMVEEPQSVIDGIEDVMKYLDIAQCVIGVEENKPDGVLALRNEIERRGLQDAVEVKVLKSTYPQGAEKVLLYNCTGKTVPFGKRMGDIGVALSNITTIAYVGTYLRTGMPLVERRITIDGDAVRTPQNLIVPIGTRIADVVEACGGYAQEPKKILMGGPMMGRAVYSDELPIMKQNNAILALGSERSYLPEETACIKCTRCLTVCPVDLMPVHLIEAYENNDAQRLDQLRVMECIECGACSFICPAHRPLAFSNKMGKGLVKAVKK